MDSPTRETEEPRLIDALLGGYAAGTLDPYLHALIESHLILSEENRAFVQALEAAAGAELDALPPAAGDRAARDHVLAAIYAGGWYGRPRPPKLDPDLPEPLARLVTTSLDDAAWRLVAPGLREHKLRPADGVAASFYKIRRGQAMPVHTHEGLEATLVLRGAFEDQTGRYRRGDVAVADSSLDHRPVADPRDGCVCFAVTDAPRRLTGPIGRVVERIFRG